ncbi:MAG TPA: hypothetical protein PK261_10025, partial [Accumulibacter sp.]|nr:hypothetical protein [Accumulibacter sp.]
RKTAIAVLIVGLTIAGAIYWVNGENSQEDAALVENLHNSKRYRLEIARFGGKGALMAAEFNEWFADQWHGRRLARSIALITLLVAGISHWVATHHQNRDK